MKKTKLFLKSGLAIAFMFVSVVAFLFVVGCSKVNENDVRVVANEQMSKVDTPDSCDLKTFTQGGWGSTPHGNNPGSYLHKNFASAFPNGLVLGCKEGFSIKLTSAQAVTDFLPCGGKAAVLTQNYTNPTTIKNVLAGQLAAISLSVGFDKYDANFAGSPLSLELLLINQGPFAGMTIEAVLIEANKALGGCPTTYSLSDLVSVLSGLNENFLEGNTNNGLVDCQEGDDIPDDGGEPDITK